MNYRFFVLLLTLAICLGCDQGKNMMKPVITPLVDTQVENTELTEVSTEDVEISQEEFYRNSPLITTSNLEPGLYRMNAYVGGGSLPSRIDQNLIIPSVMTFISGDGIVYDRTSEHVSVHVMFDIDNLPYRRTLDGELFIQDRLFNLDIDAGPNKWTLHEPTLIVVEITEFIEEESHFGPRTDRPKLTNFHYSGRLVANLTHPDRPFEYPEDE